MNPYEPPSTPSFEPHSKRGLPLFALMTFACICVGIVGIVLLAGIVFGIPWLVETIGQPLTILVFAFVPIAGYLLNRFTRFEEKLNQYGEIKFKD